MWRTTAPWLLGVALTSFGNPRTPHLTVRNGAYRAEARTRAYRGIERTEIALYGYGVANPIVSSRDVKGRLVLGYDPSVPPALAYRLPLGFVPSKMFLSSRGYLALVSDVRSVDAPHAVAIVDQKGRLRRDSRLIDVLGPGELKAAKRRIAQGLPWFAEAKFESRLDWPAPLARQSEALFQGTVVHLGEEGWTVQVDSQAPALIFDPTDGKRVAGKSANAAPH